jgi:hypothetical protein
MKMPDKNINENVDKDSAEYLADLMYPSFDTCAPFAIEFQRCEREKTYIFAPAGKTPAAKKLPEAKYKV